MDNEESLNVFIDAVTDTARFFTAISRNLNEINDIRFLPIIMHQYLEYFIDNVISSQFKNPESILKERHSFGFYEKCFLLKALGIFDGQAGKELLINIRIMTRIRNYYAHEMDISVGEIMPENIKDMINSMHMFGKIECKDNDNFI